MRKVRQQMSRPARGSLWAGSEIWARQNCCKPTLQEGLVQSQPGIKGPGRHAGCSRSGEVGPIMKIQALPSKHIHTHTHT